MKNTNAYTINHEDKTITITKAFAKSSGIINSDEYILFTQFRKDYPDYKIVQRTAKANKEKNTHKGLTLDNMEKYLSTRDNAADALKAFEMAKDYYKGYSAYYAKVKAWFLSNYKEEYENYAPAASIPVPTQSEEITAINNAA